jgi:MoxR-like ATPase
MDAAQIEKLVDKKLAKLSRPMTVTVKRPDDTSYELGACHKQVPELVKLASMRQATFLVGPAGSGKTTACRQAAEALALSFEYTAFSSQSTKTDLYGFIDAHGVYRETSFRRMYENGGFWLGDEMDAAAANILLTLNAAIDNGFASFPDKMVKAHPDFMCFAAGNTYGKGRDRQYVGRNELDAASLDRFWFMAFDYDEAFEASLATDSSWTLEVQSIRKAVFDLGERLVVSPRASIKGSKLIVAGFTREQCRESLIFRGANQELVNRVLSQAGVR